MIVHFDKQILAIEHLMGRGYKKLENGMWVSKCGMFSASIHPRCCDDVVAVAFQELERA